MFNAGVQRLTRLCLLGPHKVLKLLNLLNGLRLCFLQFKTLILCASEKQHSRFLILVCVWITEHSRGYFGHATKLHFGVVQEGTLVEHLLEKRHFIGLY